MNALPGNPFVRDVTDNVDSLHDWMGAEGCTDATRIAQALEALTAATLAHVHEQRTANLQRERDWLRAMRFGSLTNNQQDRLGRLEREVDTRLGLTEGATK